GHDGTMEPEVVLAVQDAHHQLVGDDTQGRVGHDAHRRDDGESRRGDGAVEVSRRRVVRGLGVGDGPVPIDDELDAVSPFADFVDMELTVVAHGSPIYIGCCSTNVMYAGLPAP